MRPAERHHVVPVLYLNRFTDESGAIAMLDKQTKMWSTTHPANAAVRTTFYTVDTEEGASDEVERALGQIEGPMARALRRIDDGLWPPDEEDRQAIASFIGLQVVRGVDFREWIGRTHDEVAKKLAQAMAATGGGLRQAFQATQGRDPTEEELGGLREFLSKAEVRAEIPRTYHVKILLEMAGELAWIAYQKRLSLLKAPAGSEFITSDVPVTLWTSTPGPFGSVGFQTAEEICLPIDPGRCLLLGHPISVGERGDEVRSGVDVSRVQAINRRTTSAANRFVFRRPG